MYSSILAGGTEHFNEKVLIITKMVEKSVVEKFPIWLVVLHALYFTQKDIWGEL